MQNPSNSIHARLRRAGTFIIAGLGVEGLSLLWNHPLSFIAFISIGGVLLVIGILLYLFTLVTIPTVQREEQPAKAHKSQS